MNLKKIRLELARTEEAPQGDSSCGYEFIAPLDATERFAESAWRKHRDVCPVRRFWKKADMFARQLVSLSNYCAIKSSLMRCYDWRLRLNYQHFYHVDVA